ncbi:MAG TPA: PIN domain-containing protein [Candidatus Nanoarchaeia archaeon]|nr:PIN domain-containing protein [Candidatus Nanoarchaeia archaeon]
MRKLFFDTYALIETVAGNPNFLPLAKESTIILTQLNLMEFYYQLSLAYGAKVAQGYLERYEELCVPFSTETIMEAMDFRKENKKRKLSYADCIGYTVAKKSGALFLTGDKEFKDLPNVLFVK